MGWTELSDVHVRFCNELQAQPGGKSRHFERYLYFPRPRKHDRD